MLSRGKKKKKATRVSMVFTVKYKTDGMVEPSRIRLLEKMISVDIWIDYLETFSPIANINTIKVLFSIAVNKD